MSLDLYRGKLHLGSVVRSCAGSVYAYSPERKAIGQFADIDAAAAALSRLVAAEASEI